MIDRARRCAGRYCPPGWPASTRLAVLIAAVAGVLTSSSVNAHAASPTDDCAQSSYARRTIKGCTEILRSDESDPNAQLFALVHRGLAWIKEEELPAAVIDFSRAIKLDPNNTSAIEGRARAYTLLGKFDEAIVDFTRLVQLDPKNPLHFFNRAAAELGAGRPERAISDQTEAIRLNPKCLDCLIALGDAYFYEGDTEQAIAEYDRAIAIDGRYSQAYYARAELHAKRGDKDKAIADYSKCLQLNAINLRARQALQSLGVREPYP